MASQPPNILNTQDTPSARGQAAQSARRSRLSWLRALPLLARPIAQTMPWVTLLAGCLAGTVYLVILASLDSTSQPLDQGSLRLAFLPAIAALAFVPHVPFWPLTHSTPVPAWAVPVGHLLVAATILGVTCFAQLHIIASTIPPHTLDHPPAVYPLIAQLTGWCMLAVAAAACVGRSRYADLGGAVAAPVSFAAITLAWYAPIISRFVAEPAATPRGVTIAWYAVVTAASALTCAAMRDQWHRYSRSLHRLFPPERSPS